MKLPEMWLMDALKDIMALYLPTAKLVQARHSQSLEVLSAMQTEA